MTFQGAPVIGTCIINVQEGMRTQKYLRESCYLGYPNSQRVREGVRWDRHSSSSLDDQQVEGEDCPKRAI